jgi:hypothetical protein
MKLQKVRVDGSEFFLDAEQDVSELKAIIVEGVRAGGAFVEFMTVGRGPIAVLVSPGIPVRFEVVERSEIEVDGWLTDPPPFDIDLDHFAA